MFKTYSEPFSQIKTSLKPPMEVANFFFILLLFASTVARAQAGLPSLRRGSFLSVEKQNDVLISPNGTFSSGFYKVGENAYCYSIWFTDSVEKTVVWMANRDRPVNGRRSRLTLRRNGNLVLTDADGSVVWSTNTFSHGHVEAQLLETGNMVLNEQPNRMIWESFDFPTDTLLPSQPLTWNTTLVSRRSKGTYFSGYYNFKYDDNNVLNIIYKSPSISSIFWPNTSATVFSNGRTPYNSTRMATLDVTGHFDSSDSLRFDVSDYGIGPKRRLILDYDGVLRSYSLDKSTGLWEVSWLGGAAACQVHGLCGVNGVCIYDPELSCTCPYGFRQIDPSDWSKGCAPLLNLTCNAEESEFIELQNTDFYGYDLATYALGVSFEHCREACINDCMCRGFGYALDGLGQCYPKGILLNGFHMPGSKSIIHVKVRRGSNPEPAKAQTYNLSCSGKETILPRYGASGNGAEAASSSRNQYVTYLAAIVFSIAIFEVTCIALAWWFVFRKHSHDELANLGYMVLAMGFKRFTYKELKKATENFRHEIGRGGFGTVYKGVLENGVVVAVKRLEGILQGEAEFWAEVTTIGKINHKNLVKLWGFCVENKHKMVVYEYLENGSLDKILFSDSNERLGWDKRYSIALGTAKGLAYLHEECLEWVLHCDVKPQNILLDGDLEPKVSDFGMSMLFNDVNNGFSKVRGTRGYLAPEWMLNSKIDAKVDVYSYGMVLLELLTGKTAYTLQSAAACDNNNNNNNMAQWVLQKIEQEGLEEAVDPKVSHDYNKKVERLVKVAMLCVEEDPGERPSMSKVVELLIGYDEENASSSGYFD